MSQICRLNLLGRRFFAAMPSRPKEIMSNPDCRPAQLCLRVTYLIRFVGDLDTAAKYARLAVFTSIKSEATAATCQAIIGGMLQNKRHDDAYDLYDFFFNHFKLRPNSHCCNYIIESRFKQGLVDEALGFHNRSIESGMVHDYPSQDTFRVLTKWLVHAGRMDQAEALLRDRTVGRTTYPDHVAYKNLIRGFLDLGDLDKADLVLAEFKRLFSIALSETKDDSNYENRVAFLMATFMEYWFKQGKEVEAMECYNLCVIANKLPVCTETGNALLKVLLKYGEKKHAWALYHELLDKGRTDPDTIKIMIDECFDMGRFSEAWETYNKASAKNHFLSDRYNITKCCRHGSQSFFFAVFSANHLITRFCQNGMLSEAQLVFYDSLEDDLGYIDVNIFKTLIDAFVKDGFPDDAIKISNKMIDSTLKEVSHLV
ncbi:pentatricopeptide repeat-containing protein At3g60980, mitochondrial [Arabidopsis lyrata subsp. lyrata]|uniref:pentatricopeptide repeat-containing protein At3g60980, mitochondrial n=1 Tax=Arabidopsis lyrata subsp. lyrata TaxID=81972 RepID=UPI000A29C1CF|nr:pentatricopeptide repeat-containing protein At3g60980, mitochondrial [Arabidopsis lyrata subsp. lyrata]|eukprot:XP_020881876.1 pentatricopeptide repeat-containing protein At3g60980, mitochondrial [Arabidopsis lyrata subsp. lyrata]